MAEPELQLLPLLRRVAAKADDALVRRLARELGFQSSRRELVHQLTLVQHKLVPGSDAKAKQDRALRMWMKDLKEAASRVDKAFDEIKKLSGDLTFFRRFVSMSLPRTLSDLKYACEDINSLVREMNEYSLLDRPPMHAQHGESSEIYETDDEEVVANQPLLNQQDHHPDTQVREMGAMDIEANGPSPDATAQEATADPQIEKQKRCSKYSLRALGFTITLISAYVACPASSTSGVVFKVTMAPSVVAVIADLVSATKRMPKWGSALVYLSSFLLVLVSCLLLVTFNKLYAFAFIPIPFPIAVAFLGRALCPPEGQQTSSTSSEADQELLDKIFELSANIVNLGGLFSVILGRFMVVGLNHQRGVNAVGFLFFFTVVVGLYLMMVTTVRNAVLTPHAAYLAILQGGLLVATVIATLVNAVSIIR